MTTYTSPSLLPVPELSDVADEQVAVSALADRIEALLAQIGAVPIASFLPYGGAGVTDPAAIGDVQFMLCDGRLISRVTYSGFYNVVGHSYNGGVDPGSSQVRLPDLRGRVPVGMDNMGTAQGAAGRLPNSNRLRGQNGGSELHSHSVNSHSHDLSNHIHYSPYAIGLRSGTMRLFGPGGFSSGAPTVGEALGHTFYMEAVGMTAYELPNTGNADLSEVWGIASSVPNSNASGNSAPGTNSVSVLQPYEVENYIVRVK